jgi:large conductance mechanosensitive channel
MLKEFKAFIMRGNVVDLAVAVILGAAFGAIVTSLVTDIITPLILKPVMTTLKVNKLEDIKTDGGVLYGKFIASVINFLVVSFCIFLMVKGMNKAMNFRKKKEEETPAPAPEPSNEEKLLMEIRDLLKNKQ